MAEGRLLGVLVKFVQEEDEYVALQSGGNVFLKPLVSCGHFTVQAVRVEPDGKKLFDQTYVMAVVRPKKPSLHYTFEEDGLGNMVMQAIMVEPGLADALGLKATLADLKPPHYRPRSSTRKISYFKEKSRIRALSEIGSFNRLAAYASFMTLYRADDVLLLAAEMVSAVPGPIAPGPVFPMSESERMIEDNRALKEELETLGYQLRPFIHNQVVLQHIFVEGSNVPTNLLRISSTAAELQPSRRYVALHEGDIQALAALRILQSHDGDEVYDGAVVARLKMFVVTSCANRGKALSRLPPTLHYLYDEIAVQTFLALLGYRQIEEADWVVDAFALVPENDPKHLEILNLAVLDACAVVDSLKPDNIDIHPKVFPSRS